MPAHAAPPDKHRSVQQAITLAKQRKCEAAIAVLEEAEAHNPTPSSSVALAGCYAERGDLTRAASIYERVSAEHLTRSSKAADRAAVATAKTSLAKIRQRLGSLRVQIDKAPDGLEVMIDGESVSDLAKEQRLDPNRDHKVIAKAPGRRAQEVELRLHEGEQRVLVLRLEPLPPSPVTKVVRVTPNERWIGARYYGAVMPTFIVNAFADGGTTIPMVGGAATYTIERKTTDLTFSLGYVAVPFGDALFKSKGAPDTDWEFVSSSVSGLLSTVDLMWRFPLDNADHFRFRIGGSLGIGWLFAGDLHRVQAYSASGTPADPKTYVKCLGPNNPQGTYSYCNTLDKDATHYGNYSEPDWLRGGLRPSLTPWVVLPQIGLSYRPSPHFAVDLDTGFTMLGFLTSLGVRWGL